MKARIYSIIMLVYVLQFQRRFSRKKKDILDGYHSRSRFGQALCALGDIDLDSYKGRFLGDQI